ncbi:MAG: DegT/DnrJ/EryC1/StrS family aminotransferase, partial [Aminobacteriaceae bacterium]
KLRVHGAGTTYYHDEVGLNSRLDSLQAAILRVKLRHLEEWNEERRTVAGRYFALFAEKGLLDTVVPPQELEGNYHIYHQYVVKVPRRDELQAFLEEEGIVSRVYYPVSLHLQKCFSFLGYSEGDFPVSEQLSRETLALPVFPELTMEEQERIVSAIRRFYDK